MIRLVGPEQTREYEAALEMKELLLRRWPHADEGDDAHVWIVAGANCHGQRRRDIDILLIATFEPVLEFVPYLNVRTGLGRWQHLPKTAVASLCLAIEVKDHDPRDIRFVGTTVEVRYREGWKNATEQNQEQIYSVRGYLESQGLRAPHVTPLLWLRNLPNDQLPPRPHQIIASPVTWETILNVVAQQSPPRLASGTWTMDAGVPSTLRLAGELFTKTLIPTHLDRQRVERITQRAVRLEPLRESLGKKFVVLRGRGGTGKTMYLLQLAHKLVEELDARILILTYNKALVADVRRLLTFLGIGDDIVGRTIQIQTVHSFLYDVLSAFQIFEPDTDGFLRRYEHLKDEALDYLRSGAVLQTDLDALVRQGHEAFAWDYIFVDEAQDWPENERDLLVHLYGAQRLVIADGIDQLVRSVAPVDWRKGIPRGQSHIVSLNVSLRMKAGLARFVSSMGQRLGLVGSRWQPSAESTGGRVIVVEGSYLSQRALHEHLLDRNAQDGNEPVDMLFCVPPSLVERTGEGGVRSRAAAVFESWGLRVWDGASVDVRDSYATEPAQHRIVQYESCRGLEGWIVVNLALDDFYEHKLTTFGSAGRTPAGEQHLTEAARTHAARWALIPLTRAIDTLVLEIGDPTSSIALAIRDASQECRDYVEWIVQT